MAGAAPADYYAGAGNRRDPGEPPSQHCRVGPSEESIGGLPIRTSGDICEVTTLASLR